MNWHKLNPMWWFWSALIALASWKQRKTESDDFPGVYDDEAWAELQEKARLADEETRRIQLMEKAALAAFPQYLAESSGNMASASELAWMAGIEFANAEERALICAHELNNALQQPVDEHESTNEPATASNQLPLNLEPEITDERIDTFRRHLWAQENHKPPAPWESLTQDQRAAWRREFEALRPSGEDRKP